MELRFAEIAMKRQLRENKEESHYGKQRNEEPCRHGTER